MVENTTRAKLLFVLSNDYGELFRAAYLLKGSDFESVFLLPGRLFAVNRDGLPGRALPYRSIQDVCHVIDAERPDVVFLFSGYLYSVNDIFDVDSVEKLVRELRDRNGRIVTSDPFQGILAEIDESTFSDAHPRKKWLTSLFARLFEIFRDVVHVYYIGADTFARTPSVAFYNRRIVAGPSDVAAIRGKLARTLNIDPGKRRWLFIMSLEDYATQVGLHGRAKFGDLLIGKLQETTGAGRQPVLIAPQPCLASVGGRISPGDAVVRSYVDIETFTSLVVEAECVFYWNIFSNTTMVRILNGQPFFSFDPGHMARAMPHLFEIAAKRHQCGEPVYLDQTSPLVPEELAALAAVQEEAMRGPRAHFERSPAPEAMVDTILRG